MIPRLPPVVLAAIAGATVYGVKHVLDRLEPKAIGPPGSSEHAEKLFKYRRNVNRAGIAVAASGIVYAGYWAYQARHHRSSPAVLTNDKAEGFHRDQYGERDRKYTLERENLKQLEREHELKTKKQLEEELRSMEKLVLNNK